MKLRLLISCLLSAGVGWGTVAAQDLTDAEIDRLLSSPMNPDTPGAPTDIEQVNLKRQEALVQLYQGLSPGTGPELLEVHEDGILARHPLSVKNVKMTLPGKHSDRLIVLGAHLDQVLGRHGASPSSQGVIDNWSGIALLVKLYERLQNHARAHGQFQHTLVFVGFAYEESGLWGSESYVQQLKAAGQLQHVKAMVNFECLGVSELYTWDNGSTEWLEELATTVAKDLPGITVTRRMLQDVGADSVPFLNEKRPAITFDSLASTDFSKIHSPEDNRRNISNTRYRQALQFAEQYLKALDESLAAAPELADQHYPLPHTFTGFTSTQPLPRVSWEPTASSVIPPNFMGTGVRSETPQLLRANERLFGSAIEEANNEWLSAARQGDAAALARLYAEDATIIPSEAPPQHGREFIEEYFENFFQKVGGGIHTTFTQESLLISGKLGYETGRYSGAPELLSHIVWKPSYAEGHLTAQILLDAWYDAAARTHQPALPFLAPPRPDISKLENAAAGTAVPVAPGVIAVQENHEWVLITVKNGQAKRTRLQDISTDCGTNIFP